LKTLALAVPDISLGARKFKMGHVTQTMSLLSVIRPPYAWTLFSLLVNKIWSL